MTDFETGLRNAFVNVFPQVTLRGCWFHFRQCNVKHMNGDPELRELMSTDPGWALELRKLIALSFVPKEEVVAAFDEVESSRPFLDNAEILERYIFNNTWIGGFDRRGNRKPPLFSIESWNCYDSVIQGLLKTNNFCEGFNNAFSSMLSAHHPTLDRFTQDLLKRQRLTECTMEQFLAGTTPKPSATEQKIAEKLKHSVDRYGTIPTLDFLRGAAYNFSI
ncbi:hypothetical protein Fcan01_17938 [Folsomia candida]|uniref:MULE transposase domain-containing protein n=1 Tax=Folsomia candida TaxID=158441 RepID=A0A226DRI6_FOLCA|nr:hypothetical protein Fcan01_17938 [Folsomia candida]